MSWTYQISLFVLRRAGIIEIDLLHGETIVPSVGIRPATSVTRVTSAW